MDMMTNTAAAAKARKQHREAALSASREARIFLQHVEKALKDTASDMGETIEQLAAAQSYVQIALKKLSSWEV